MKLSRNGQTFSQKVLSQAGVFSGQPINDFYSFKQREPCFTTGEKTDLVILISCAYHLHKLCTSSAQSVRIIRTNCANTFALFKISTSEMHIIIKNA